MHLGRLLLRSLRQERLLRQRHIQVEKFCRKTARGVARRESFEPRHRRRGAHAHGERGRVRLRRRGADLCGGREQKEEMAEGRSLTASAGVFFKGDTPALSRRRFAQFFRNIAPVRLACSRYRRALHERSRAFARFRLARFRHAACAGGIRIGFRGQRGAIPLCLARSHFRHRQRVRGNIFPARRSRGQHNGDGKNYAKTDFRRRPSRMEDFCRKYAGKTRSRAYCGYLARIAVMRLAFGDCGRVVGGARLRGGLRALYVLARFGRDRGRQGEKARQRG